MFERLSDNNENKQNSHLTPEVQGWIEKHQQRIDMLRNSDYDVYRAYGEVYQAGCFVKEFNGIQGRGVAAVGELSALMEIEDETGKDVDLADLSLMECIALTLPGMGNTRSERIHNALQQTLNARVKTISE